MNRITLYVNPKQKRADSTYTVYVATVIDGQPVRFNTGVHAPIGSIDSMRGAIRGTTKDAKDKNLIVSNCKSRISDIFVRYRLRFSELTPELLRREYDNYTSNFIFYDYAIKKLCDNKLYLTHSSYKRHLSALKKIKTFSPKLQLTDVTESMIQEYIRWCKLTRKNKASSICSNIKILKQYFFAARKEGLISGNPFESVRLRVNIAVREYLSPDELKICIQLYRKCTLPEPLQNVLRYFLFSCLFSFLTD